MSSGHVHTVRAVNSQDASQLDSHSDVAGDCRVTPLVCTNQRTIISPRRELTRVEVRVVSEPTVLG